MFNATSSAFHSLISARLADGSDIPCLINVPVSYSLTYRLATLRARPTLHSRYRDELPKSVLDGGNSISLFCTRNSLIFTLNCAWVVSRLVSFNCGATYMNIKARPDLEWSNRQHLLQGLLRHLYTAGICLLWTSPHILWNYVAAQDENLWEYSNYKEICQNYWNIWDSESLAKMHSGAWVTRPILPSYPCSQKIKVQ